MKNEILRILYPHQIRGILYVADHVALEWRLGDNWKKQEPTLVRVNYETKMRTKLMATSYFFVKAGINTN